MPTVLMAMTLLVWLSSAISVGDCVFITFFALFFAILAYYTAYDN